MKERRKKEHNKTEKSVCVIVYSFIYLSFNLSYYLSIYLSIDLCVCLNAST